MPHLERASRASARAVERGGADEVVAGLRRAASRPSSASGRTTGVELSGGQWQKIALARAFMREEADMLVLDEPTAALDAEAEHAVFERFRTLAAGRTTFLISHRFSTVRMADRILVIEGGRIVEDGSHEELVAAGRRYAHLFDLPGGGLPLTSEAAVTSAARIPAGGEALFETVEARHRCGVEREVEDAAFSAMRSSRDDFGSTTRPCWMPQRISTCAGVRPTRARDRDETGWPRRSPRVSGLYASTTIPCSRAERARVALLQERGAARSG